MTNNYPEQIQRIRGIGPAVWPRNLTHPARVSARVALLNRIAFWPCNGTIIAFHME